MKERDGQGQDLSQNELTRQADSSNLESGDIFMAADGGEEKGGGEGRPKGAENLTHEQRRGMDYKPPPTENTSGDKHRKEPSESWIGKDAPAPERTAQRPVRVDLRRNARSRDLSLRRH